MQSITTMNFMNDDEANSWTTVIMNFMSSVIINSCKLMQTHAKPYRVCTTTEFMNNDELHE
jgi:hypothetical protein